MRRRRSGSSWWARVRLACSEVSTRRSAPRARDRQATTPVPTAGTARGASQAIRSHSARPGRGCGTAGFTNTRPVTVFGMGGGDADADRRAHRVADQQRRPVLLFEERAQDPSLGLEARGSLRSSGPSEPDEVEGDDLGAKTVGEWRRHRLPRQGVRAQAVEEQHPPARHRVGRGPFDGVNPDAVRGDDSGRRGRGGPR